MLAITPHERYVLRRELDWYHGALGDLVSCLKYGRSDLHLRWRTHIALSLLDDLGWQHEDPRGEFHITLDVREFAHWLRFTIEENDGYIDEQRGNLASSRKDALDERRYLVAASGASRSLNEIERDYRDEACGHLDEALELRLVATNLLARLEGERG
jgi:hypothetical protein